MGENQKIALQNNFNKWKETRGLGLSKQINPFEYYCMENYLRDWVSSDEDLKSGLIGGSKDGGVDAMYFFVNRQLVKENVDPIDPANVVRTDLLLFQIKEGDGFAPGAIDKLDRFSDDLLGLSRKESDYGHDYRPDLKKLIRLFKDRYQELLLVGSREFEIHFYYIVGKDVEPNEDCTRSEQRLKATVKRHFDKAKCVFHYINITRLWEFIDGRPRKQKVLKWAQQPLDTPEGFVGLVTLPSLYEFLQSDENPKELNNTVFESNVRGFWPSSPINTEIRETLENSDKTPEFWLLNNGITILAGPNTGNAGGGVIEIHDPQIVNGLQTSRVIFEYYDKNAPKPDDKRRILVRVLKLKDEASRGVVIKSTNNQNKMPVEALRATDPIHRMIEEVFPASGFYYDRRIGYWKDQGKPAAKIVSIVELLQAVLSCIVGRPDHARGRPRDYFKDNENYPYEDVFGEGKYNLNVYIKSVRILERVDRFLEQKLPDESLHRRNLRFYLCMYCVSLLAGRAKVLEADILKIDPEAITDAILEKSYAAVRKSYDAVAEKNKRNNEYDYDGVAKGVELIKKISQSLNRKFRDGPALSVPK